MKSNCKCDQQKTLKSQIRTLKRIVTGQRKCIMLLKRKINTDDRLRKCQKTIDRCLTSQGIKNNRHAKDISSDEDICSETSEDTENPNISKIEYCKLNLNND